MKCDICMCGDCVRNPFICLNTPTPCGGADCDICNLADEEEYIFGCNQHLTLAMIDDIIEKEKRGK